MIGRWIQSLGTLRFVKMFVTHFFEYGVSGVKHLLRMAQKIYPASPVFAAAFCCAIGVTVTSGATAATKSYNVPGGDAAATLTQFARHSGCQIVYLVENVRGEKTLPVRGEYVALEALRVMLGGTALFAVQDESTGALVVSRKRPSPAQREREESERSRGPPAAAPAPPPDPPKNNQPKHTESPPVKNRNLFSFLAGWLAAGAVAAAQTASAPANDETVSLSPFEVKADKDVGYQASNTTSGSRLNTKLKDTSAPVSVFTKEFLSDFGLTNLEEMMSYSANFEKDFEDSNAGFNAPSQRGTSAATPPFRVRGLAGSFAVDLVESAVPQDNYNIERIEVSSGPNSVLFGLGQAGGIVSLTSKMANVRRNATSVKGTFGSWNFHRAEFDANRVLVKNTLGFRLNALDTHQNGWRTYDFAKSRRIAAAVTYQPFEHTTVRAAWDAGTHGRHTDFPWPAGDGLMGWVKAGRPVVNLAQTPFNAATFAPLGINRAATDVRWTLFDNTGEVVNMLNRLQSYIGIKPDGTAYPTDAILTPYSPPVEASFSGPGSFLRGFFRDYSAKFEQRWGRLVVEGAFLHTFNKSYANGWLVPTGGGIPLRADPNATLPFAAGAVAANPYAGRLYVENTWRPEDTAYQNVVYRLSAAYEHDFGRWLGRHRFAGLAEAGKVEQNQHLYQEILVNQNNVPITNTAAPELAQNHLYRRHYATEGAYDTYYMSDVRIPLPNFTVGANTYHPRFVANGERNNSNDLKLTDTLMIADQAYFWKDRIIATAGYRVDKVKFKNGVTSRLAATDPAVVSGERVANELQAVSGQFTHSEFKPHTLAAGVVIHATSRLSFFYNRSNNVGAPLLAARILPESAPPSNVSPDVTKGRSRDFGLMFDLLGDDRYFLRATRFDTEYLNSTPVKPGVNPFLYNQGLGLGLDALVAAGRITADQTTPFRVQPSDFSVDVVSSGYEAEMIANPNRNLSLRATFSYSDRNRENFAKEVGPFFTRLQTFLATVNSTGVLSGFGNYTTADPARTAKDMIIAEIDGWYADTETNQLQPFASRPYKFNLNGRYRLTDGRLEGLAVGGGVRWQSKNYMQSDNTRTIGGPPNPNYGRKYYGQAQEIWAFFATYRTKLPFLSRKNVAFQLNVRNAFNQSLVQPGKYTGTDFVFLRRVYINEPRSFRFSTEVEF